MDRRPFQPGRPARATNAASARHGHVRPKCLQRSDQPDIWLDDRLLPAPCQHHGIGHRVGIVHQFGRREALDVLAGVRPAFDDPLEGVKHPHRTAAVGFGILTARIQNRFHIRRGFDARVVKPDPARRDGVAQHVDERWRPRAGPVQHVVCLTPQFEIADRRDKRRHTYPACDEDVHPRVRGADATSGQRHPDRRPDIEPLVHEGRSPSPRHLVLHGDDIPVPVRRRVAQRVRAHQAASEMQVDMRAGGERRQWPVVLVAEDEPLDAGQWLVDGGHHHRDGLDGPGRHQAGLTTSPIRTTPPLSILQLRPER